MAEKEGGMSEQRDTSIRVPDVGELGRVLARVTEERHVPGAAVGLLVNGQELALGQGITSVDNPLPVDAATLFQIGSITKTFTGTAVMRLVERGDLDLDSPVRSYLPELRLSDETVAEQVTLRHLLTHTAGWVGDLFDDTGPGDDALARIVAEMASLPQLTPLGQVWSYCNSGFYLVGRVVEVVTEQPFEQAVTDLVLAPLGMAHTFFFPADVMTYRFVAGHIVRGGRATVARPWALARSAAPAGGLISCVGDLLRYARFHLGTGEYGGERLLSPDAMALMQTPLAPAALDDTVGVAWMLSHVGATRTVSHGGGTNGQSTHLLLVPAHNLALVVLTNVDLGGGVAREVTDWVLQDCLGVVRQPPTWQPLPPEELAKFTGRYCSEGWDVELRPGDGVLVLQAISKGGFPKRDSPPLPALPAARVGFCGRDRVLGLDPPFQTQQGEFLRAPDGTIEWFRWSGRICKRQDGLLVPHLPGE